jgi:hypothetical protein
VCGAPFQRRAGSMYCDASCKQTAYRERLKPVMPRDPELDRIGLLLARALIEKVE